MKTILQWMRGWRLREIAFASAIAIGVGYTVIYFLPTPEITPFDPKRDTQPITTLFKKDLYWLAADPNYDIDYTLKHMTPSHDPAQFGKLKVDTIYKGNQFAGFTAYHIDKPLVGRLLFLLVNPEFRGKKIGEKLVQRVLNQLKIMGAKKVVLATRVNNVPAQKLYERVGFKETNRDDHGFMYYEYVY